MQTLTPITKELVFAALPIRAAHSHKGNHGRVLCLCGSPKYRGAAALACLGALRTGAGLVTLAAEENVIQSIGGRILEAMFLPLPDANGLAQEAEKATVCLAGCGKEANAVTSAEMQLLLKKSRGVLLLDAGGLGCFSGKEAQLKKASGRLIITPHMGEMAVLTGLSAAEIAAAPAAIAMEYAQKTGAVVVLKSHRTIVATPEGAVYENTSGNAGLARGGSGDLLSGMIAGLAAEGLSCSVAAICGVYLHGAAADLCAARSSMQAMLPEDILQDVHTLFLEKEHILW